MWWHGWTAFPRNGGCAVRTTILLLVIVTAITRRRRTIRILFYNGTLELNMGISAKTLESVLFTKIGLSDRCCPLDGTILAARICRVRIALTARSTSIYCVTGLLVTLCRIYMLTSIVVAIVCWIGLHTVVSRSRRPDRSSYTMTIIRPAIAGGSGLSTAVLTTCLREAILLLASCFRVSDYL